MVVTLPRSEDINWTARAVIDGDIHPALASPKSLDPYLSQHWRAHRQQLSGFSYSGATYPRANPNAARVDSWPPNGQPPGSDLNFMREQLLDEWDIEVGVLQPLLGAGAQRNLEYGAAMSHAINDWLLADNKTGEKASLQHTLHHGVASGRGSSARGAYHARRCAEPACGQSRSGRRARCRALRQPARL